MLRTEATVSLTCISAHNMDGQYSLRPREHATLQEAGNLHGPPGMLSSRLHGLLMSKYSHMCQARLRRTLHPVLLVQPKSHSLFALLQPILVNICARPTSVGITTLTAPLYIRD